MGNINQVNNFTFWYSIISTVIGILLLVASVGFALKTWLDSKNKKAQVKIWMQDANGVQTSLQRVVGDNLQGRYSSTNDMANAIWAIQAMAFALYQSLFEERCVSEKDFIKEQNDLRRELSATAKKIRQKQANVRNNPQGSTS